MQVSILCLLSCFFFMALAQMPPRPKIPETFTSWVEAAGISSDGSTIAFEFLTEYVSRSENANSELYNSTMSETISSELYLYDQGKYYDIEGDLIYDDYQCYEEDDPDSFPQMWSFLDTSDYMGHIETLNADVWMGQLEAGYNATLAVASSDPNTPLMLIVQEFDFTSTLTRMSFVSFSPNEPDKSDYIIPPICNDPSSRRARNRKGGHKKHYFVRRAEALHQKRKEPKHEADTKKKQQLHPLSFFSNVRK